MSFSVTKTEISTPIDKIQIILKIIQCCKILDQAKPIHEAMKPTILGTVSAVSLFKF